MSKPTKLQAEAQRVNRMLSDLYVRLEVEKSKVAQTEMRIWKLEQRQRDLPKV